MKQFSYPRPCYGLLSCLHLHIRHLYLVVALDSVMGRHLFFYSRQSLFCAGFGGWKGSMMKRKVIPVVATI